mgnify:CR=1 FL=1
MKKSLSRQMTAVFVGLLAFVLAAVFIVNAVFLGHYYTTHKESDLLNTYNALKEAQESESKNNNAVEEVPHKSEQPAKEFNDSSVSTPVQDDDYVADETAVITEGLSINGDLDSLGSIDLFGTVEGNVSCRGKLTVNGSITGNSKANEVFANNAQIDGDIEAKGSVKIGQGTVIVGNIVATSAVIAGAVKGDIDVHGPVVVDSSAVIVGDIKSKSVQINNGATIDGRCSQCYAEVNMDNIFNIKTKKNK